MPFAMGVPSELLRTTNNSVQIAIDSGARGDKIMLSDGIFRVTGSLLADFRVFTANVAILGGGICYVDASPRMINCTFVNNSASYGSVIFLYNQSSVTVNNCLITFNQSGSTAYCLESSTMVLSCSDMYGNAGGDWTGCTAGQEEVDGNFSSAPLFCDVNIGDVGLRGED